MHSARPPIHLRRPSPALSRSCRPLVFASREPHALPSYLHQMSADQQIRGSGWQGRVGTGGQISRLLGWGVAAEGVQEGRKCRIPMAACLHGRKCQHLAAVCVCCCQCSTRLILVQASRGWCAPILGCLHRLVCLYKAQINSNQVCATNSCIYDLQSSYYDTSPEQRQHINSTNAHKQTS